MKALAIGLLAWMLAISAPGIPGSDRAAAEVHSVSPDTTVADTVRVDQVLILALPDSISGLPVDRYHAVRIPAEGWLYERSFFWRPRGVAPGDYLFILAGHIGPSRIDTVRIAVRLDASYR